MAHWDSIRDQKNVEMMKQCNVIQAAPIIDSFEETGDPIYLDKFVELMREYAGIFRARQSFTL